MPSLFELLPPPDTFKSSLFSTEMREILSKLEGCWSFQENLHSSLILLSFAGSFSSGSRGFPDELLFLLSFVSLLLLLSLLFTLLEVEAPPELDDDDGAGSFLMMLVGGEPSSCLIDVTMSCSDEAESEIEIEINQMNLESCR